MTTAYAIRPPSPARRRNRRGAFTLIEVLVVVVVLGIAGVLVIPSMSQTNVLRVQAAVRTVVADIALLQAEAVAFQERRVIWFGMVPRRNEATGLWEFVEGNGYTMAQVRGAEVNLATDALPDPDRPDQPMGRDFDDLEFGGARVIDPVFNGGDLLIFDELGGPVAELDGPDPGAGGNLRVTSPQGAEFRIDVQAFTGRVVVTRLAADDLEAEDD